MCNFKVLGSNPSRGAQHIDIATFGAYYAHDNMNIVEAGQVSIPIPSPEHTTITTRSENGIVSFPSLVVGQLGDPTSLINRYLHMEIGLDEILDPFTRSAIVRGYDQTEVSSMAWMAKRLHPGKNKEQQLQRARVLAGLTALFFFGVPKHGSLQALEFTILDPIDRANRDAAMSEFTSLWENHG